MLSVWKVLPLLHHLAALRSLQVVQDPRGLLILTSGDAKRARNTNMDKALIQLSLSERVCSAAADFAPTVVCLRTLTTLTPRASGAPSLQCPPQWRSSPPLRRAGLRPERCSVPSKSYPAVDLPYADLLILQQQKATFTLLCSGVSDETALGCFERHYRGDEFLTVDCAGQHVQRLVIEVY